MITTKEQRESFADALLKISEDIRSGAIEVSNIEQTKDYERWWVNHKWEYFSIGPQTFKLTYSYVDHVKEELAKKAKFLEENPTAELVPDERLKT